MQNNYASELWSAKQNALKCITEVAVAASINDRIQCWICVSCPKECSDDCFRWFTANGRWAERSCEIPSEKGEPANEKSSNNNPQCSSSLVFSPHPMSTRALGKLIISIRHVTGMRIRTTYSDIFHLKMCRLNDGISDLYMDQMTINLRGLLHSSCKKETIRLDASTLRWLVESTVTANLDQQFDARKLPDWG